MSNSVAESRQNRIDIVRYLRQDLEIARTLARLKEEQSQAAALRVTVLEDRVREAEAELRLFQTTESSPEATIADTNETMLDT